MLHLFCVIFYVFSISFLNTCFSCSAFVFSMDLGTLNPQNASSYLRKTNNCLKLPFLKHIEQIMISRPILASSSCHHFSRFSWAVSLPVFSLMFNDFGHWLWRHVDTRFAYMCILFRIIFINLFVPVSQKVFLDVPFSLGYHLGSMLVFLWLLFCSHCSLRIYFPFRTSPWNCTAFSYQWCT